MMKKHVKRLFLTILTVSLLMGLTACGNEPAATDTVAEEPTVEATAEVEPTVEDTVAEESEAVVEESTEEAPAEETVEAEVAVVDNRDLEGFAAYAESYADGEFIVDKTFTTMNIDAITDTGAGIIPDSKDWFFAVGDFGGAATASLEELEQGTFAKIDVTNGGSQNYAVQLIQHMPIIKGYKYVITFDAMASEARSFVLSPSGDGDNSWVKYATLNPSIGTEMATYSFEFTMNNDTDPTARMEFNLGQGVGTIWIGNVSVTIAAE